MLMGLSTKVIGSKGCRMDLEFLHSQMEVSMKVIGVRVSTMAKVCTKQGWELGTMENGKMENTME